MPAANPPEIRRRAVELARRREKAIAEIAHALGVAESCLRRWLKQDDIDTGRTEGVTTDERAELCGYAGSCGWLRWRSRFRSEAVGYAEEVRGAAIRPPRDVAHFVDPRARLWWLREAP